MLALPPYPRTVAPEWCAKYVGNLPYERGARGPDLFDCWGAVMLILQEEAGLQVPSYEGVCWNLGERATRKPCAQFIAAEGALSWDGIEPGAEAAFDVIVLRLAGNPLHVGVVAAPGWMMHSDEDAGCALERYDDMHWRNRVEAFWRFRR